jgi:hypothetical protein
VRVIPQHDQILKRAIGDARLLGVVFIAAGLLIAWFGLMPGSGRNGQIIGALAGVFLIGPGVLYLVSAHMLYRRLTTGAKLARWAGAGHLLATVGLFVLASVEPLGWPRGLLAIPAIVSLFFIPALVAFLIETRKALIATSALGQPGRAFEPVVTPHSQPVLPIPPNPPDQDTSSRRPK